MIDTKARSIGHVYVCAYLRGKMESVENGVGVDDSSYLASLAKSLKTYSERVTSQDSVTSNLTGVTGRNGNWGGQNLWSGAGNMAALVGGVTALASARSAFTETPCTYDEVEVTFAMSEYF